jgi:hypothetical protein
MSLRDERMSGSRCHALLEQPHDELRVLRVVLVPGVDDRFVQSSSGNRRYKNHVKAFRYQPEGDRAAIVSRRIQRVAL